MLPDLHFLLGAAVFQPLDAIFTALNLGGGGRILLLQLLDLAALVQQCGNSPRPAQRHDSVHDDQPEHHGVTGAAANRGEAYTMREGMDQGF